jgi:hypothetical protein
MNSETPIEIPAKALPDFFRAMQKRTKPASGPYSFIPDKTIHMVSDGASFVLRIHAAGPLRNYVFRARFVEAEKKLRLEWNVKEQIQPKWILVAGAVVIALGVIAGANAGATLSRYMYAWVLFMAAIFFANYRTMLRARTLAMGRFLDVVRAAADESR